MTSLQTAPVLARGPDGCIRLAYGDLAGLCMVHWLSQLDDDHTGSALAGAVPTAVTGYTEWVSVQRPAASIGWDWEVDCRSLDVALRRLGAPRTNTVLVGPGGAELAPAPSAALLGGYVDTLAWQAVVLAEIAACYRWQPAPGS